MNTKPLVTSLISLSALTAGQLSGQESPPPIQLEAAQPESRDRFGLDFRLGFNIRADFKSGFGPSTAIPGPGIHGVNRTYDDGFNKVDITGNAGGYTSYWSYDHASQIGSYQNSPAILMHSASGSALSTGQDGGPQPGFELTYNHSLGGKGNWRWGVEAAFNFMNVTIHDSHPLTANGTLTTDTYPTPGGYPPPPAGYPGDYYNSAGAPQLYDSPGNPPSFSNGRTVSPLAANLTGSRDFDANVFGWRLGPYVETSLGKNVSLSFSAGLSLAVISSDFSVHEVVSYFEPGSTTDKVGVPIGGSSSQSALLAGGYVSGQLNLALSEAWSVFGGVQFQDVGQYSHQEGNSYARLDLSSSLFVMMGASYSF